MDRLARALAAIDAVHAEDPRRVPWEGGSAASEWVYAERMTAWLERLAPAASEELRLAVRAQHLRRWELPRSDYPPGRTGYLRWRRECARRHAAAATEILAASGYGAARIERVRTLLEKRDRARDPEVQALEDAACLVFLEHELEAMAARTERAKLIEILRKTWRKMSPAGQRIARELRLSPPASSLLAAALESSPAARAG